MSTSRPTHTPTTPHPKCPAASAIGAKQHERGEGHRARDVARVPRADEDPVEREHDRADRLHQREQRPQVARLAPARPGRSVNARGRTSAARAGRRRTPSRRPATSRSSAAPRRGAPPRRPAPSIRPTRTWPAIAIASSTSARKMNSWKAIWCAASAEARPRGEHAPRRA